MKKVKKIIAIFLISVAVLWGISVGIGVNKYGSWSAYWANIKKTSNAKKAAAIEEEKAEVQDDCCCCIPYQGQAGTCMETKKMSKKRCLSKGGTPLLDSDKCD